MTLEADAPAADDWYREHNARQADSQQYPSAEAVEQNKAMMQAQFDAASQLAARGPQEIVGVPVGVPDPAQAQQQHYAGSVDLQEVLRQSAKDVGGDSAAMTACRSFLAGGNGKAPGGGSGPLTATGARFGLGGVAPPPPGGGVSAGVQPNPRVGAAPPAHCN